MSIKQLASVAAAALAIISTQAKAATVLEYTGNTFTSIQYAPFGTSLDAKVITNSTLASNFTGTLNSFNIASFTLTVVGGSVAPAISTLDNVFWESITLTNGQVTSWYLAETSDRLGGIIFSTFLDNTSGYLVSTDSVNTYNNTGHLPNAQNYTAFNSGSWTISTTSAVPETSTWAMMLAGFAGLGFAGYRRNKSAALAA